MLVDASNTQNCKCSGLTAAELLGATHEKWSIKMKSCFKKTSEATVRTPPSKENPLHEWMLMK